MYRLQCQRFILVMAGSFDTDGGSTRKPGEVRAILFNQIVDARFGTCEFGVVLGLQHHDEVEVTPQIVLVLDMFFIINFRRVEFSPGQHANKARVVQNFFSILFFFPQIGKSVDNNPEHQVEHDVDHEEEEREVENHPKAVG